MKNIICPISNQRANAEAARLTALITIGIVLAAFALDSLAILVFLVADFLLRASSRIRFSPVTCAAQYLVRVFALRGRQIDKAPKIFAARMGFLMTAAVAVLFAFDMKTASAVLAWVLVLFASLEFLFAVCVGCAIYTYVVLPFYRDGLRDGVTETNPG